MAEREECKIVSAVNSELEPKSADDGDESSASEYEEIIEEVTDYSDTNSDADADPVNEVDTVKEKELVKQASSKDIAVAKESQSTEILAVVDADNSAAEDATTVNECQVESRKEIRETCKNEVTESESGVNGELLTPTLQHLLPYKTPQIKETATQNSLRSVNSLKTLDTRTNINNIENSISSESSNRLSVSANNKYLHTNNNNKSNNNNNTYNDYDDDNNTKDDNMRPIMMTTMTEKQNKKPASDLSVSTANLVREQLGIPTREDSGTESGDDLRLIAAGIRDKLNMQSDTNLIQEVTAALNRLECSLKEGKDISLDERKRNALLALVERLQSGLTSPEKLADDGEREMVETSMNDTFENDDETSSPEADTHRTSRQRFAKRRIRNSRHTVGVSREELEDARRYMEDMFLMENFSTPTTPEGNPLPPSWNPIVKNLSSGAILMTQPGLNLCRPNQFVPNNLKNSTDYQRHDKVTTMPISGDYSLSTSKLNAIEKKEPFLHQTNAHQAKKGETSLMGYRNFYSRSPEFPEKSNRFSNKKLLMKRANTIDIPKAKNSSIDFETDSDADEKNPTTGLKRTVQVNVKRQVRNVVPPFEPKTENDHKFLAFINKQSASPGLGWNNSKSVTNWTNKFGSIKHAFEMGAAAAATSGKPPQVPAHATQNSAKLHWQKHEQQHQQQQQQKQTFGEPAYSSNARTQRSQKGTLEQKKLFERESIERERQERERLDKFRYERECLERKSMREKQERESNRKNVNLENKRMSNNAQTMSIPVNQFNHAPQSVFKPINDNAEVEHENSFRSTICGNNTTPESTHHLSSPLRTYKIADTTSPCPATAVSLPWLSKHGNSSLFKERASRFEEKPDCGFGSVQNIHRHNSLRSNNVSQVQLEQYRRPSLPNTSHPYYNESSFPSYPHGTSYSHEPPPPPINASYKYADYESTSPTKYPNYSCHPSVLNNERIVRYSRRDSLTNPQAEPLILSSARPSYSPQKDMARTFIPPNQKYFDYASPMDSVPTSPNIMSRQMTDATDDDLDSDGNVEYRVHSKVMGKPRAQKAVVTVVRKTSHVSDDEVFGKNSRAARNLLQTMRHINNKEIDKNNGLTNNLSEKPIPPKVCLSPDGSSYQAPVVETIFPHLNNFETNRLPLYSDQASGKSFSMQSLPTNNQQKFDGNAVSQFQENMTSQRVGNILHEPCSYRDSDNQTNRSQHSASVKSQGQQMPIQQQQHYQLQQEQLQQQQLRERQLLQQQLQQQKLQQQQLQQQEIQRQQFQQQQPREHQLLQQQLKQQQLQHQELQQEQLQQQQLREQQLLQQKIQQQQLEKQQQLQQLELQQHQYLQQQLREQQLLQQQLQQQHKKQQELQQHQMQQQLRERQLLQENLQQRELQQQQQQQQQELQRQHQQRQMQESHDQDHYEQEERQRYEQQHRQQYRQQQNKTQMDQRKIASSPEKIPSKFGAVKQDFKNQEYGQQKPHRKNISNDQQIEKSKAFNYNKESQFKTTAVPVDTPDIVKSSLPKDEYPAVAKKFGPPQRHHYIPNAYQSPTTQIQMKENETNAKIKQEMINKIEKNSIVTNKPIIVDVRPSPFSKNLPQQQQANEDIIPRNIVFNNVNAFTSLSRRTEGTAANQNRSKILSKCDSWAHITQQTAQQRAYPVTAAKVKNNPFQGNTNEVRRSKSGNTLAIPKMYEAGIDKAVINEKQKTVAAYFSGNKSVNNAIKQIEVESGDSSNKKSVVSRAKSSTKATTSRMSLNVLTNNFNGITNFGALARSATMPHIANIKLLDETNVEDAFEQLMMGS